MAEYNTDQVTLLQTEITKLQNEIVFLKTALQKQGVRLTDAGIIVRDLIENKEITDEEAIAELSRLLSLDLTKKVTVNFTASVEVELEVPYNTEEYEIENSLEIYSVNYNGDDYDVHYSSISDVYVSTN
jgi:hypothetical protein